MDVVYQKDAFSGLTDKHKTSMFQNAKLKDEVTLQGVGLNNLGSMIDDEMMMMKILMLMIDDDDDDDDVLTMYKYHSS